MHRQIGTAALQTDSTRIQVTFSYLGLQRVDHIHGHVQNSKLGLGFVPLVRFKHHTDSTKFIQSIIDVSDPHPLPGVIGKPPVLHLLRVIVLLAADTAHTGSRAGSFLPLPSSLPSAAGGGDPGRGGGERSEGLDGAWARHLLRLPLLAPGLADQRRRGGLVTSRVVKVLAGL